MEILNQLGGLVLGSVPTAIFLIVLVFLYGVLVRKPLERTLAERYSRTAGALDQAKNAIATAESETAAYEEKLRAARAEVAKARDQRLKQLQTERDKAVEAARLKAKTRVDASKQDIEKSAAAARQQIEDAAGELSAQILGRLLPSQSGLAGATK